MKKYIFGIVFTIFVVIGGLTNLRINPKTDGTIKTSFTLGEILVSIGIILVIYLFYFLKIKKNFLGAYLMDSKQKIREISDLNSPIRSSQEYFEATNSLKSSFSNRTLNIRKGRTIISEFSGAAQYIWDGECLSKYGGGKIIKFDGQYISNFAGTKLYSWKSNCLSIFAGNNLYSVSNGTISTFAGPKIYRFDKSSISVFAGKKIFTIQGDIDVPEAIIVFIVDNLG